MITNIYVNGIQVNNSKVLLQKLSNIGSAEVEFAEYQRGGASGQILSRPLLRGIRVNMEWFIKGDTPTEYIANNEAFAGYFSNSESPTNYFKTFGVELANGVIKEADVLFSKINNEINANNINYSFLSLSAVSEKEFFTARETKTGNIYLQSLGGMAIPMPIPMSMANNPVGEPLIAVNSGNARSYPIITVHAIFADDFTITNDTTGDAFVFAGGLGTTDYITIDTYYRTATLNDTTSVLGSFTGDWLYFNPGSNQLRITSTTGADTGYCEVTWKDSYRNI